MITQLVMFSTIILLFLTGGRIFKKSRETEYTFSLLFAIGLILIGLGILFYAIRDIFIQYGMMEIQIELLMIGGVIQILGGVLVFIFFSKEFTQKVIFYYTNISAFIAWVVAVIFIEKIVPIGSELERAPLEFIEYYVVRNYPETILGATILTVMFIYLSALILGIILHNSLKIEDKKAKTKGLFYGLGILFLIVPMVLCILISPIYARIGYLIGAILIYKAVNMKVTSELPYFTVDI